MIVHPSVAHLILARRKTALRQPVRNPISRWRSGRTYAILSWTGSRFVERCRVEIDVDPWAETLSSLTGPELLREGYDDLDPFIGHWLETHDRDWMRRHPEAPPSQLDRRYETRWADSQVWVCEFHLTADEPRYLAPGSGYTGSAHRALQDYDGEQGRLVAAETVAVEALDRGWQVRAQARHAKAMREAEVVRQERREQRSLGQRLDAATAKAKARGANVSNLEAAARRRVEVMERIADEKAA